MGEGRGRLTSPLRLALIAGVAAFAAALLLRHLVVEPQALGLLCDNPGGPAWCAGRQALIFLFHHRLLAAASVALALAALVLRRRAAAGLAVAAVAAGAAGAVLYNLEWAVPGLLLGLLRAARLDAAAGRE